jgi:cell division protein FtsX
MNIQDLSLEMEVSSKDNPMVTYFVVSIGESTCTLEWRNTLKTLDGVEYVDDVYTYEGVSPEILSPVGEL